MSEKESMHNPEDEGDFGPAAPSDSTCDKCGQPLTVQTWDSHCGGFRDYKFTCTACGHYVWIEGPDS
jgi:hypothetical protein